MLLQIRSLTTKERHELYKDALEYFNTPVEERKRVGASIEGVCEYLWKIFYPEKISKIPYNAVYSYYLDMITKGIELLPELYRRKTTTTSAQGYWFNNDEERIEALRSCIEETNHLAEWESDEQPPKVYWEGELYPAS